MGKNLRILMVDSSEEITTIFLNELLRCGYEVEYQRAETTTIQDLLKQENWDAILGPYNGPQSEATRAVDLIRAHRLDLPLILSSQPVHTQSLLVTLQPGTRDFVLRGHFAGLGAIIEQELRSAEVRQKNRQALPERADLFRSAFHRSPVATCITTPDGRFKDVNQALLEMLGFTRQELEGRHFNDITHPDDLEIGKQVVARMISGELASASVEKRYLDRNGQTIWGLVNATLLRDPSGQPLHFITHILNLTEHKQAEQALYESQSRLAGVIETAMDAIITIDEEQRITLFNPAAEHIFQVIAQDVLGKPLDQLIPEQFRAIHRRHVRDFGERDITRRSMGALGVLSGRRANGEEFPIEASISQLRSGNQKFYTVILRDITERKRAEQAALESEARYHHVLDAMMEGCQIIDFDWRYVYVNDVVALQGRHTRAELINHTMMEVYPGIETTDLFEALRQCMEQRTPRRMENQFYFEDGNVGWFELSIQPAREGIFILSTDITERKRAEESLLRTTEDLRRSNRELEQFAYVSSHDLQEPLRMVSSYVQLLAKRYKGRLDPDADDFIGFAVEGATRMQQLINDLLTYSRVGTQGKPFALTDLEMALESALSNLQIAIKESSAMVTHDPLPILMADHIQMVQLFQNLIGNAIKFRANDQPRVHVRVQQVDSGWQFSVIDNGIGIDPQFNERIFVIFQRLHTRAEYQGTGIGLAICKKIVERHGGNIWVEPAPDQGSVFHFTMAERGGMHDS